MLTASSAICTCKLPIGVQIDRDDAIPRSFAARITRTAISPIGDQKLAQHQSTSANGAPAITGSSLSVRKRMFLPATSDFTSWKDFITSISPITSPTATASPSALKGGNQAQRSGRRCREAGIVSKPWEPLRYRAEPPNAIDIARAVRAAVQLYLRGSHGCPWLLPGTFYASTPSRPSN